MAQCPLGEKFGCDPELEAPVLISLASELGLNVSICLYDNCLIVDYIQNIIKKLIYYFTFKKVVGISFHVGSGCMDLPVYAKAIYVARQLFDYAQTVGYYFSLLDIGGGFPGDKNTDITKVITKKRRYTCDYLLYAKLTQRCNCLHFLVSRHYKYGHRSALSY